MVSHGHAQRNEFNVYITRFTARVNSAIRWHAFSGSIRSTHKTLRAVGGVLNTRSLEAAGFYLRLLFSSRALNFWLEHVYGEINTTRSATKSPQTRAPVYNYRLRFGDVAGIFWHLVRGCGPLPSIWYQHIP